MMTSKTARLEASPWRLIRQAAGGPRALAAKVRRLGTALAGYVDGRALDDRLERLQQLGLIETVPTRLQLVVGAVDMLRFWIVPAAQDYYAQQGIDFRFHQLLRFLDDPASLVDPTGFLSQRDVIIGHVMQVVHANPCYDMELLCSFEGGLEEMQRQVEAMLAGTHPRAASIGAIVEDPGYHQRLLAYVREFRANPASPPPVRDNVQASPRFAAVERAFGTLPGAMRYFARLPTTPLAAARHLATVRAFPG